MAKPDESWFVSFYEHDPSKSNKCIHFKKDAPYARCGSWIEDRDRNQVKELRRAIIAASSQAVSLELISKYISYSCCTFAAPAGHRQKIVDDGNLMPLARRWQNEIWQRAASQSSSTSSAPAPQSNIFFAQHPPTTPATSTPSYTATSYNYQLDPGAPGNINTAASYIASYASPQYNSPTPTTAGILQQFTDQLRYNQAPYQASPPQYPNNPTPSNHNSAFSDPITSSPSHKYSVRTAPASSGPVQDHSNQPYYNPGPRDAISQYQPNPRLSDDINVVPSTSESATQLAGNLPRYPLRSREVNGLNSTPGQSASDPKPPQTEFRIYRPEPGPSDSVARKILAPLEDEDFITGSLYGFTRDSSLGHVKIGWTRSVDDRLKYWSKHGDNPKLLFSVHLVPYAQRAETLTHYELIKERRWERRCESQDCNVNHMEWFEVGKYRAKQVVADWAEFIERAEPYDQRHGSLTPFWKKEVETMDGRGELVTAKKLLERYEAIKTGPRPKSEPDDREALMPGRSPVKALSKTPDPAVLSSPKPNVRAESDSLPVTRKELADAIVDIKEAQDTFTSILQRLQNIELGMQAEPQREVLPRDGQIRAKAEEGRPHRQVGSPGTKDETEEEEDGLDPDKTLIGDQSPHPSEKIASRIVRGFAAGISAGKANTVEKGADRPKAHEHGAPPLILP